MGCAYFGFCFACISKGGIPGKALFAISSSIMEGLCPPAFKIWGNLVVEQWQLNQGHVRSPASMKKLLHGCCKHPQSSLSSQICMSYVEYIGLLGSGNKKARGAGSLGNASILCPEVSTPPGSIETVY